MASNLKDKDIRTLEALFIQHQGRGFEPASMRAAVIMRALKAKWLTKCDDDFFWYKKKGCRVIFTEQAKSDILKRMAERYSVDAHDLHHLVRTGSFELVSKAVPVSSKAKEGLGEQISF